MFTAADYFNIFPTVFPSATAVLPHTAYVKTEECIDQLFDKCQRENPDHGCATFYNEPITPHFLMKYRWVEKTEQCSIPFGFRYYTVAIPKNQHGAWIVRSGDGGFENWRFDSSVFNRVDKRLSVK